MKRSTIFCLAFALTAGAWAQGKLSPASRHLLLGSGGSGVSVGTRAASHEAAASEPVGAYLHVDASLDRGTLEALGVQVNLDLGDLLTVRLPLNALEKIAAVPGVNYVQTATAVRPMMDKARPAADADRVLSGEGLQRPYTGKGVVVGIIDSGFDYTHPNFYSADGSDFRIHRVWEQRHSGGTPPDGFSYGSEFTEKEAILTSGGDVVSNSHGTHVAGIAAGAYRSASVPWYGLAPDADLVLVGMGDATKNNVNISDAIAYIFAYAESVGKPCVINMSLGTMIGPHDGTSVFDQTADRLQGQGRLLVGSSGNFGADKIHVSRNFSGEGDGDLRTLVNYKLKPSSSVSGGEIDIWGTAGMKYDVQLVVYNTNRGEVVDQTPLLDASVAEGNTLEYEFTNSSKGKVLLTSEINPFNGKTHTFVSLALTNLRYGHALGVIVTPRSAGEVHAWADDAYVQFTNEGLDEWQDGDTRHTLAEIGGTAKEIISVGAFTTRKAYTIYGTTREEISNETEGAIASFSGKGAALDGRMKPDVAAPGTYIASSVSSHDVNLSNYPIAGTTEWQGKTYHYVYMQGTSMAAPFVSGVVATWLEANPNLTAEDLRAVLAETSLHDDFTTDLSGAGRDLWGHGKINAHGGLQHCLQLAAGIEAATVQPAATPATRLVPGGRLLFARSAANVTLSLYDLSGKLLRIAEMGRVAPGQELELPIGGLSAGAYVVRVATSDFAESHKVVKD